jgi:predicted Zn-dependent peptidase
MRWLLPRPDIRSPRLLFGTALLLALPALVAAQSPRPIPIDSYTLPNGLKVILAEDHSAQVVTVNVWYNVGSRNERPGRTGFAHLFEHMMFQGSANVKKGDHMALVQQAGGTMNGSTADDRTNYWQTLPSNRLNLGLWLEADRMRSLAVTKENFENQRETVKEERRLRIDNQPYTGAFLSSLTSAFDAKSCFAYAHETIGSMDDLNAAKTEDVQEFFKTYYAPNNASLVVTGDFQSAEAKQLISTYFASIPRATDPPAVTCSQAMNTGLQRRTVTDAKANLPAVLMLYRIPEYKDADTPALEFLSTILGGGESSRINRAVVRDAKAAVGTQVLAGLGPRRGANVFGALAIANQGVTPDSLEKLISKQIAEVAANGVTPAELEKAKNAYRAGRIGELQTSMGRAEAIHTADMFLGDPKAVNAELDRHMAVTVDDIKRVAARYLRADNSVITLIKPEGKTP